MQTEKPFAFFHCTNIQILRTPTIWGSLIGDAEGMKTARAQIYTRHGSGGRSREDSPHCRQFVHVELSNIPAQCILLPNQVLGSLHLRPSQTFQFTIVTRGGRQNAWHRTTCSTSPGCNQQHRVGNLAPKFEAPVNKPRRFIASSHEKISHEQFAHGVHQKHPWGMREPTSNHSHDAHPVRRQQTLGPMKMTRFDRQSMRLYSIVLYISG